MTYESGLVEIRIKVRRPEQVIAKFDPGVVEPARPPADYSERPKVKTSFYQSSAEAGRMRAAYLATQATERHGSLSAFIDHAVRVELERLESLHNDGKPWAPVKIGDIPKGAPLRM